MPSESTPIQDYKAKNNDSLFSSSSAAVRASSLGRAEARARIAAGTGRQAGANQCGADRLRRQHAQPGTRKVAAGAGDRHADAGRQ